MVGEAVQQSPGQAFRAEYLRPLIERQVGGHQDRAPLVALAEDFEQQLGAGLRERHEAGAFFVTRAKSNIDAHRVYLAPTDRSTGIICDQTISLDGFYTRQDYPELLRRIRFKDPESGKTLVFITNNFSLPVATAHSGHIRPVIPI